MIKTRFLGTDRIFTLWVKVLKCELNKIVAGLEVMKVRYSTHNIQIFVCFVMEAVSVTYEAKNGLIYIWTAIFSLVEMNYM